MTERKKVSRSCPTCHGKGFLKKNDPAVPGVVHRYTCGTCFRKGATPGWIDTWEELKE